LPSRWVFREANPDYGIDGQIEVFDKNNAATGLMFLVQLKGTDDPDVNDALSIQFRLNTLKYYRKLDLPVMIVFFHAPTKKFFWKWAHEVDTYYAERGQEHMTVRISENGVWEAGTPSLVEKDLTEFREIRSPSIPLPQRFSLVVLEHDFHDTPRATLEAALIEAATDISDLVCLSRKNSPGAHPTITIERDQIVVSLSGLKTITFHTEAYPPELVTTKLPHDLLTAVALVFGSAGHFNVAAQIACKHLDKSSFLRNLQILFRVLRAIARARRLTDGLRLAEALLKPATLSLAQLLIVPALISGGASLSTSEREYLRYLMKQIIEGFEANGQDEQAATAHYNLGQHLRAQRGPYDRAALKHYRLAARGDPMYRQRHYFWREVGGILFGLGRFGFSASAYDRAIRLGGETECVALRADALMFAGRYSEAHQSFRVYLGSNATADAEWRLKKFAVAGITKFLGLDKQRRDENGARRLADVNGLSPDDVEASMVKALGCDALCALAWFNLAVTAHAQKRRDDAFLGFLLAGLIGRTDPEAWANALLLSLGSAEFNALLVAIALTAYKINGHRFFDALRKVAEAQQQGFATGQLLNLVWEIVNSAQRPNEGFEVRLLGEGSSYQSIKLASDLTPKVQHQEEPSRSENADNMPAERE